jgi:hypothetical protein
VQESGRTVHCPRCRHENSAETSICNTCGLQISGLCPSCVTQNANAAHFCGNCGYDFVLAHLPSPAIPSFGESDLRDQKTAPATVNCPRCHRLNDPSAAFCYNCGLPFDGTTRIAGSRLGQRIPAFTQGRPGGFWSRLVALFIDGIVVAPIIALVITTFTDISVHDYVSYYIDENSVGFDWGIERFNFVDILYHTILVGLWSTTVGKKALGLYVLERSQRYFQHSCCSPGSSSLRSEKTNVHSTT